MPRSDIILVRRAVILQLTTLLLRTSHLPLSSVILHLTLSTTHICQIPSLLVAEVRLTRDCVKMINTANVARPRFLTIKIPIGWPPSWSWYFSASQLESMAHEISEPIEEELLPGEGANLSSVPAQAAGHRLTRQGLQDYERVLGRPLLWRRWQVLSTRSSIQTKQTEKLTNA
ncbi:uncharacterized protein F5Z01DRAFT_411606 [Emericellopsis atlantica]|uniref:Uncharacterized protein n=1 Tax=Emericellopsis atlantica TaxID=2614577 RepID=A0A9P7ZU80_9HYPO|nr:uncharacterized protein F5Z01DRAFT_411606 [Emericellopsis atlantica]KAG9257718.1 hypothetical protein F5Z01DRAFT_411606 [Emericellopsis atlantica]